MSAASEIVLAPADPAEQFAAAQCVTRHARDVADARELHAMLGLAAPAFGGDWALAARIHDLAAKVMKR